MQMTIQQLMMCAKQLQAQAESKEFAVSKYREELDALKNPYEDFSTMPKDIKKEAFDLEALIHKRQEEQIAYQLLADFIMQKNVGIQLL